MTKTNFLHFAIWTWPPSHVHACCQCSYVAMLQRHWLADSIQQTDAWLC